MGRGIRGTRYHCVLAFSVSCVPACFHVQASVLLLSSTPANAEASLPADSCGGAGRGNQEEDGRS